MSIEQLYDIYKQCTKVITDSRAVEQNSLFFALKGENFDGNKFAQQALEQGASYAVIDDATYQTSAQCILVEDTLKSLQQLANFHRQQFKIPVIGVTGSNGKTTTKELMYSVLSSHYPTHATQGNFNNHIGVPLTLLAMKEGTEVAIIEMGMNHLGEIAALCEIANPTHGLITNIGKAHLEGVGSLEGVKQAKSELYNYLKANKGLIFVNRDEAFLWDLVGDYRKTLSYSQHTDLAQHYIYQVNLEAQAPFIQTSFQDDLEQSIPVNSQLIGTYNFNNIMTAIVIGQYFKVPPLKIKAAIKNYQPANNRSQIVQKADNTFLLDAYNANPSSMRQMLLTFKDYPATSKIAILGDMLELGTASLKEHQDLLEAIKDYPFTQLILVGKQFKACQSKYLHFDTVEDLKLWFDKQDFSNTTFLIKGSRGIRLERLVL